jgi:hypothetical protein
MNVAQWHTGSANGNVVLQRRKAFDTEEVLSAGQAVRGAKVSPGYFEVLKIPVKRGRTFGARDDSKSPAVVVINERMALQYWKDGNALGERIAIGRGGGIKEFKDEPVRQIVGIVAIFDPKDSTPSRVPSYTSRKRRFRMPRLQASSSVFGYTTFRSSLPFL